jgi:hypothetical protein
VYLNVHPRPPLNYRWTWIINPCGGNGNSREGDGNTSAGPLSERKAELHGALPKRLRAVNRCLPCKSGSLTSRSPSGSKLQSMWYSVVTGGGGIG